MKIGDNFSGFGISSKGLSIQRKKMNLIAENLANGNTVRTEDGKPINRKILNVKQKETPFNTSFNDIKSSIQLSTTILIIYQTLQRLNLKLRRITDWNSMLKKIQNKVISFICPNIRMQMKMDMFRCQTSTQLMKWLIWLQLQEVMKQTLLHSIHQNKWQKIL